MHPTQRVPAHPVTDRGIDEKLFAGLVERLAAQYVVSLFAKPIFSVQGQRARDLRPYFQPRSAKSLVGPL